MRWLGSAPKNESLPAAQTAQAFPRFSLAWLLKHFCEIDADKQYQLADWRVRPLTAEMRK